MSVVPVEATLPFPFAVDLAACDHCFGIGLRINPLGVVEQCPTLQMNMPHRDLSPAGSRIARAVELLTRQRIAVDAVLFDIARSLARYTTEAPCGSRELIERHFSYVTGDENRRRKVTNAIHDLQDIWLLPVGSRKEKPSGYWIITEENDFRSFIERVMREPVTRLATLHRLAKANWPEFAEQMEMDLWKDMGPDLKAA